MAEIVPFSELLRLVPLAPGRAAQRVNNVNQSAIFAEYRQSFDG